MSSREKAVAIINSFPDEQIENVISLLQVMKQVIGEAIAQETPNAETLASMEEIEEMIRTDGGEHFTGSTSDLFASILAGDD